MSIKYKKVQYKGNKYGVLELNYKTGKKAVVMDWKDFEYIKGLKKAWKCNNSDLVSCSHNYDDTSKEIFIHDVIMALVHKDNGDPRKTTPIVHINNIGLDNRRKNLMYDDCEKPENKNAKKKKRTIKLPKSSGINVNDIPTYVWYLKSNGSHGERFAIEIGDIKWKTKLSYI